MEIIRGPIQSAQRVVIYGPEGIGKSTLASRLPKPIFIDTEGSTKQLDVARFPFPTSWAMLIKQVEYVRDNPDLCKTLVIDTADWAESLCKAAVCARANKEGIEDFGYGKGYVYLAEEFGKLLNTLNEVIERGINVVFTAHAQMRKFEQPDEAGSYDRWELKLEKKTAPMVKEWADMVLFANYKTIVVNVDGQGVGKGRNIAQGGKRVIYTTHHPAWDAKNRHDLPDEIPMEWSSIAHCFPVRSAASTTTPPTPAPTPAAKLTPESEPKLQTPSEPTTADTITYWYHPDSDEVFTVSAGQQLPIGRATQISKAEYDRLVKDGVHDWGEGRPPEPESTSSDDLEASGVPRALADLMRTNDVTLEEIQAVVAKRGYFPADTPFANYPKDFVEGVLIGAWPKVLEAIQDARLPF